MREEKGEGEEEKAREKEKTVVQKVIILGHIHCPGRRPAFRVFHRVGIFFMWVSDSVSDSTLGEKAGDLEVMDCFQQLELL